MTDGTNITAQRDADFRITYTPQRGFTFGALVPIVRIWGAATSAATPSLTITTATNVNGSSFVVFGTSVILTIKKADLIALPAGDLYYDVTLTDALGFINPLIGGYFDLRLDGSDGDDGSESSLVFSLDGDQVNVSIMGGALAVATAELVADVAADVITAQAAATAAAVSAAAAVVTLSASALKANNLSDLTSAATARTNIGLLGMATQAPSAVAITGGTITGITDLAVADGGTGASTAAAARTALAVVGTADLAASTGASLVGYLQAGTGAVATTAQTKLRLAPISTTEWGITADSNGTTGNGTDWTTQLQALVTYARANGRNIWVPAKPGFFIRFTGSINFTGTQTKMEVIGESNFDSAFFADFTSTSNIAAFSNNSSAGARSYVGWRNFRLQGRIGDPATNKVRGIYSNWGGEFTEFESLFVIGFYDNIVISNDYNVRMTRCLSWYAKRDNLHIGYDISGAIGACNNVNIEGTHLTYAARYGGYVYACRAITISGGGAEANAQGNLFFDSVYGGSINGYYMEYGSAEAGNPTSQLRLRNCSGCTVNGLSVSAFDNSGEAIVYVDEGNNGIVLNGLAIETAGADTSAIGVLVRASFGVSINSSFFDGMTMGIRATEGSRVTISESNILAATPVSTDASGNVIVWRGAIDSQVTASVASIGALTAADIIRTTLAKNVIDGTKIFQAAGTYSILASAATKITIDAELLSESYRITNIFLEVVDAFAGGGGNRALTIRDSTTLYTTIPAASLQLYGSRGAWGSTVVPYGAANSLVTATVAGADLYMQYSGGTTDYTTGGVIVVYVEATRIA